MVKSLYGLGCPDRAGRVVVVVVVVVVVAVVAVVVVVVVVVVCVCWWTSEIMRQKNAYKHSRQMLKLMPEY